MLRRATCLIAILLATSCAAEEDDPAGGDGADEEISDDLKPFVPPCANLDVRCPAELTEIGEPGAFAVDTFDIEWQQCEGKKGPAFAPFIHVAVPDDIVSLSVTVDGGSFKTGFIKLKLGDQIAIKPQSLFDTPMFHAPLEWLAATVVFPNGPKTPATPGCLALMPIGQPKLAGKPGKVHIVSRRGAGKAIDLNLVVVEGTKITDQEVNATADILAAIYAEGKTAMIRDRRIIKTSIVPPKINIEGKQIDTLRALQPDDDQQRMNVFFIADFADDPGTLGFAGGTPGPIGLSGTAASGVTLAVDGHLDEAGKVDTKTLAETLAHELGHQLGLFHTTEEDMGHDILPDTPDCPTANDKDKDKQLSAEECMAFDGAHMMFWEGGIPQRQISPMQAQLLLDSPVAR